MVRSAYLALELHDFLLDLDISGGGGFPGTGCQRTGEFVCNQTAQISTFAAAAHKDCPFEVVSEF